MEKWLLNEIITGLKKIILLSLPGTPPSDGIAATAVIWVEALQFLPMTWDEKQDRDRVRDGFRALLSTLERWPAPKNLIDALPRRKPLPALSDASPATPTEAKIFISQIKAMCDAEEVRRG